MTSLAEPSVFEQARRADFVDHTDLQKTRDLFAESDSAITILLQRCTQQEHVYIRQLQKQVYQFRRESNAKDFVDLLKTALRELLIRYNKNGDYVVGDCIDYGTIHDPDDEIPHVVLCSLNGLHGLRHGSPARGRAITQ